MRTRTKLAVVAGGALVGGTLAWYRLRVTPRAVSGIFLNGMAYARVGSGPMTLLFIPGGVGVPTGPMLAFLPLMLRPFIESGYTVWVVARRRSMPKGHTMADMADDYAGLIADEFDGKVDLVLGESYGGMIGFYLAARHPDRFGHIAITVAGYKLSEAAVALDLAFAKLLGEGRRTEAGALRVMELYPDIPVPGVTRVLGAVLARLFIAETHPHFASDVMVEAEAEGAYDAREVLPQISVPVLLVGGDRDQYFPKQILEETARNIADCTLRIYEGKDHVGTNTDKRLYPEVLDFVRRRSVVQPEGGAEQPTSIDRPAVSIDPLGSPTPSPAGLGAG